MKASVAQPRPWRTDLCPAGVPPWAAEALEGIKDAPAEQFEAPREARNRWRGRDRARRGGAAFGNLLSGIAIERLTPRSSRRPSSRRVS